MASTSLLRLCLHPSPPHKTLTTTTTTTTSLLNSPPFSLLRRTRTISLPNLSSTSRKKQSTRTEICCMSYKAVPATDRLISAVSYFLPLFNGLQYGRYLFMKYPSLAIAFQPIFPLLNAYRSIPYASFVAFFALYLGVVRNPSFSRYVRFNSMQAVVLDVLLALPLLFQRVFSPGGGGRGLGFQLLMWGYNGVFIFILACVLYSVGYCVLGRTPYLPLVASAADRQL